MLAAEAGPALVVITAAAERGWTVPATGIAALPSTVTWYQARSAIAFLWEQHPSCLPELLGEIAQLARPIPA